MQILLSWLTGEEWRKDKVVDRCPSILRFYWPRLRAMHVGDSPNFLKPHVICVYVRVALIESKQSILRVSSRSIESCSSGTKQ